MSSRAAAGPYRIAPAEPEHVQKLAAIERAAAQRFSTDDLASELAAKTTSVEELGLAQVEGRLWVALAGDQPVGFALVRIVDGRGHLEEMDVHPDYGRCGLGSQLLEAALHWSRSREVPGLTLTTFDQIAWNRPFYERRGFTRLEAKQCGPELACLLEEEKRRGLRGRVAMIRSEGAR